MLLVLLKCNLLWETTLQDLSAKGDSAPTPDKQKCESKLAHNSTLSQDHLYTWYNIYCIYSNKCAGNNNIIIMALMYLETKTRNISHLRSFLQLLQKVLCLGDFFDSVTLGKFATLRSQLLEVL